MRFFLRHLAAVAVTGAAAASAQQTAASAQQTAAITAIPTTTASSSSLPTLQLVEIDVVFPRWNETYSSTELFPIVLAVQNFSAWQLPDTSTTAFGYWYITVRAKGITPSYVRHDNGSFHVLPNPSPGSSTPTFLVALANHSTWHGFASRPDKMKGDKYALGFDSGGSETPGVCDAPDGARLDNDRAVMFDVWDEGATAQTVGPNERYTKWGVPADLIAATGCPQVGAVVAVTSRSLAPCGVVALPVRNPRGGNPCAVTVDRAMMSSVSSAVASLSTSMVVAAAVEAAKVTTAVPTTRTSTGGAAGGVPAQTALAAACVLCGLAAV